jgi:hypothetical protein
MSRLNHTRKRKSKKNKYPPVGSAEIGTAIIISLVQDSKTREEDRAAINAIRDSVWQRMNSESTQNDKVHWATAGILAAYNLGKTGIKIPSGQKKVATP